MKKYLSIVIYFIWITNGYSQYIEVDELVEKTKQIHPSIQQFIVTQQQIEAKKKMSINIPDIEFLFQSPNGQNMRLGVMQTIPFPAQWITHHQMVKAEMQTNETLKKQIHLLLENQVRKYHLQAMYYQEGLKHYQEIDSVFGVILQMSSLSLEAGKISEYQMNQAKYKKDKAE